MQPILFWILGACSLMAGLVAIGAQRPLRSTQGLVALMITNVMILFLLSATLLAIELLVVTFGAALMVWMILVRTGRMKLGTPGRTRYNVTKLLSFFVALGLVTLLLWSLSHSREPIVEVDPKLTPQGEMGAWLSLFIVGIATVTTYLVVVSRRRED